MKSILTQSRWSPYGVGVGIGMLSWVTFALMDKALGASTTLVRTVAAIERTITPSHVYSNEYFSRYLGTVADPLPIVEWQFALVVMMVFGAMLSSWLSGSQSHENIPRLWKWRFGPTKGLRYAGAFLGGVILLFGARLAGRLYVGSWNFRWVPTGGLFLGVFYVYVCCGSGNSFSNVWEERP